MQPIGRRPEEVVTADEIQTGPPRESSAASRDRIGARARARKFLDPYSGLLRDLPRKTIGDPERGSLAAASVRDSAKAVCDPQLCVLVRGTTNARANLENAMMSSVREERIERK